MSARQGLALALALGLCGTLHAESLPQGSGLDERIRRVDYSPDDVVLLYGAVNVTTRIVLEPGEKVLVTPSPSFPAGWQVSAVPGLPYIDIQPRPDFTETAEGPVKIEPRIKDWSANLPIATNLRLYDIWLELAGPGDPIATRIEFRYPERKAAARATAVENEAEAAYAARVAEAGDDCPIAQDLAWTVVPGEAPGSEAIAPYLAHDDGVFTYLGFSGPLPAILALDDAGAESIVNPHVDPDCPDVVILDRVPAGFALRRDNAVVGVYPAGATR